MIDLTEALSSIVTDACPSFQPRAGSWTPDKLRALLDANGQTHRVSKKPGRDDGIQFDLARCPFCQESEGNPSVWTVDGNGCFRCFREKAGCATKSFADLLALFTPRPKLPRINALELPRKYPNPRQHVVKGLLRRGDVVNVIGGPKARKSFFVEQLALSIAGGIDFLVWPTVPGKVLLIDNELRGDDLAQRLTGMAAAMGLNWDSVASNIDIMPLRGTLADVNAIHDELCNLPPDSYSLVIVDALYKTLPTGTDENSNSNMTACYVLFDESAERQNCALTVVHHTSKGAQHAKSVSDMGAGAGAQSRSADCHIVLREHEAADTVVLQAISRKQPSSRRR